MRSIAKMVRIHTANKKQIWKLEQKDALEIYIKKMKKSIVAAHVWKEKFHNGS